MENRILPLAWLLVGLVDLPAWAVQTREVRDGATVEAVIAAHEPTRIRIEGEKIIDVVGNIHSSSNCAPKSPDASIPVPTGTAAAINPAGQVTLACDLAKGEIYIQPVGTAAKPINLFISSATATYTLRLNRADVPADTIVISDKSAKRQSKAANATGPAPARSAAFIRSLKSMLVFMATEQVPDDVRMEERNEVRLLWAESEMKLIREFDGRGFIGETYALKNISGVPLVLAEQEFDRDDGDVLAVAIENLNLRPNESTRVYVIRAGE
ncbi:type-F conjugative transfer system secretin TraK [Janthinobacterium sp. NKUCC06_STL]|uniref:type-F conjugative transfer system secretin TraK n=1 Tax=Janthinobacterium sp. NKUCC06_STL TaxID=2842127 RepID=UPI001C5BD273|nr:type-F conjugative transfer system secretin TraK [Janthinobacterium sp. NKUCC06_STL]MBW3512109.1 type-F conjugative transfer system secretin TraK [Janthinobacterium sp. NKUCC06_STL]